MACDAFFWVYERGLWGLFVAKIWRVGRLGFSAQGNEAVRVCTRF